MIGRKFHSLQMSPRDLFAHNLLKCGGRVSLWKLFIYLIFFKTNKAFVNWEYLQIWTWSFEINGPTWCFVQEAHIWTNFVCKPKSCNESSITLVRVDCGWGLLSESSCYSSCFHGAHSGCSHTAQVLFCLFT